VIRGEVDARRYLIIPASVRDSTGQDIPVQLVIDTGFDGYISLPSELIKQLDLPFITEETFTLADETEREFKTYAAIVVWGEERGVLALMSDGPAMVGMAMLYGFRVTIDVIDGGEVIIEPRP
jgi:clan AA aspartic protease